MNIAISPPLLEEPGALTLIKKSITNCVDQDTLNKIVTPTA